MKIVRVIQAGPPTRIINVEPLPARTYNGLDVRQGHPVIQPMGKKVPWWKKVLGL